MSYNLMQRSHQRSCLFSVFLSKLNLFRTGGKFFQHRKAAGLIQRAAAARKKEALGAILLMDFILIRQIVAYGTHVEVAGLNHCLYGLGHRRLYALLAVLRVPWSVVFKILGIRGQLLHQRVHPLVGHTDKALRTSFCATGVTVYFDKAVGEVHGLVVLYPVNAEG